MVDARKFEEEIHTCCDVLSHAKRVLITAPGTADGDSIGAQLALRRMLRGVFPQLQIRIINDEPIPDRYQFLPDVEQALTPESFSTLQEPINFDVGFIVDGGIDRAGRVKEIFDQCRTKVFIDHHAISAPYPYDIKIVESDASATTEVIYHLSQLAPFHLEADREFAQQIYLGLIFDTGFFRHSNTTPEVMELGAELLRTGFDFTRVGERGMLERSFSSLKLMAETLIDSKQCANGKIIWSSLTQERLRKHCTCDDDREGIIDHLFLTKGIEVAVLFFELPNGKTKLSFRSQGVVDVAEFARSLTVCGGGHRKAAGALIDKPIEQCYEWVLSRLEAVLP